MKDLDGGFEDMKKDRLEHIEETLAKTAKGRDLLTFAKTANTPISFNSKLPDGIFGNTADDPKTGRSKIFLNPRHSDKILVSFLYHELRHVKQKTQGLFLHAGIMDGNQLMWPVKNPFSFLVIDRIAEADAFARQAEFAFESTAPVRHAMAHHCKAVFNAYATARKENPHDREGALLAGFTAFIQNGGNYDATCLNRLSDCLKVYKSTASDDPALASAFFSAPEKFPLSTSLIRAFAKLEKGANYLSSVTDAELKSIGGMRPNTEKKIAELEKKYNKFFAQFNPK